jgi:hypothetical protein
MLLIVVFPPAQGALDNLPTACVRVFCSYGRDWLRYRAEGNNRLKAKHFSMYHVYEYEATKTCPECSEQETVPVATYIDEETGRQTVMAKRVKCERHLVTGESRCGLSGPIGAVTEISMTDSDAYDYMAQKIRDGYNISYIQR